MHMISANIQHHQKRISPLPIFFILFLLGIAAYANAIFHPFVHDDVVFIQNNLHIADLNLSDIFSPGINAIGHSPLTNNYYRPVLELFYRA